MNARNILWNLLGLGLPLLFAVLTVPQLILIIGTERFGFLALAWGLIGYAGILDLGVGRAVTQKVAALRDSNREVEIPDIIQSAIRVTGFVGGGAVCLIVSAATLGAGGAIPHVEVGESELKISVILLAFALPLQAVSAIYKGVNEAYLNFKGINLLRIVLGVTNFGGPYLVALYSSNLYFLVATLVLSRAAAFFVYKRLASKCLPAHVGLARGKFRLSQAKSLFAFGGWLTISSIISPFLVQGDRFFVGALISAAAVTHYVVPYEIAVQAMIFVGAVTTVVFPLITHLLNGDSVGALVAFKLWTARISVVMFLVMSVLAYLMPYVLHVWVGESVSHESVRVGQVLCLGVFLNSIGAMYYSMLHAYGRTKITALLHLLELPIFVFLLYFLINAFGILGAAIAWVCRVGLDMLFLMLATACLNRGKLSADCSGREGLTGSGKFAH